MSVSKKRWPKILGAVVLLLVALSALAVWRLDAFLLRRAREEVSKLSAEWGRPITLGGLSTTLFPSLGVKAERLEVGAGPGESVPLAQVARAEVAVRVGSALFSLGKDIQVSHAEVSGLVLNVERLRDGSTNLTRLQEKLGEKKPEAAPAAPKKEPQDLSFVRVDRAALTDGMIRFVDHSAAKTQELAISDLDLEVKDLRAGQPLDVSLAAAVLQAKQNLRAHLRTAPLPKTLVPVAEQFSLKAEPIDLSPLGPFFPEAGLRGGTVEADFRANLGKAVPGGQGETRVKGFLRAQGMRFAEAEGGKPLDARLDADISGDAEKGDLSLDLLELKAGAAQLSGKGRVRGLLGENPSVQGLEVVGTHLDLGELSLYYPSLRKQLAHQISGPLEFQLKGSGSEAAQSLTLEANLNAVRLRIPEQLSKEPGAPMRLSAKLNTAPNGVARFDAQVDLSGVDLRPGGALNKAPGQRLEMLAVGTFQSPRKNGVLKLDLSKFELRALQDVVTAVASAEVKGEGKARTVRFNVNAQSPHLDADALLLSEEGAPAGKPTQGAGKGGQAPQEAPGDPARFNGTRGDIRLEIGQLRIQKTDLTRVVAELKMVDDLITVQRFDTGVFGGQIAAGGSSIRLGPPAEKRPFTAKVQMKGIDMSQAIASKTDKKIVSGSFTGNVDLQGTGLKLASLEKTLEGNINGQLDQGSLLGLDVVNSVTKPLAAALPFASKANVVSSKATSLGDRLPFGVVIAKGVAQLKKPITWTRPEGTMSFDGGMKVDGRLDLAGIVQLSPATIQTLTAGKVVTQEPIPVPLKITGPAWQPQVSGVDVKPAAVALTRLAAASAAKGLLKGRAGAVVDQALQGGAAQEQAAQQRQQAEKKAQDEAAAAKKRLEDEAQKRLKGLFQ